eukprot:PhF_6_TR19945/c0_g1_i1/m.29033
MSSAHVKEVTAVGINNDRSFMYTGSIDGALKIWNLRTASPFGVLIATHTKQIRGFVLVALDRFISYGDDGRVILWSSTNLASIRQYFGHVSSVTAAAYAAQFQFVIAASSDGSIRVWKLDGTRVARLTAHGTTSVTALSIVPTTRRTTLNSFQFISSDSTGRTIVWMNTTVWKTLSMKYVMYGFVQTMTPIPNGVLAATSEGYILQYRIYYRTPRCSLEVETRFSRTRSWGMGVSVGGSVVVSTNSTTLAVLSEINSQSTCYGYTTRTPSREKSQTRSTTFENPSKTLTRSRTRTTTNDPTLSRTPSLRDNRRSATQSRSTTRVRTLDKRKTNSISKTIYVQPPAPLVTLAPPSTTATPSPTPSVSPTPIVPQYVSNYSYVEPTYPLAMTPDTVATITVVYTVFLFGTMIFLRIATSGYV